MQFCRELTLSDTAGSFLAQDRYSGQTNFVTAIHQQDCAVLEGYKFA